jgi:DNA-binding MarR family transcriptional regulator
VQRVVSTRDRRARQLSLTPDGERLLATSRLVVETLQTDILAPLSPTERGLFLTLAQKALGLDQSRSTD